MTAKGKILAFTAMACLAASTAQAQLVRQTVVGVWRQCVYRGPPRLGSYSPRRALNTPSELIVSVGRGEPCPATYPGERRPRRAPPAVSTWSSEPPP